ncbi:hypothetical protein B0H14DRAFT_3137714 [Mycena olivaceomarginata]|nr:hypothetical protein B0H14DRAFT_3137714 [Mycena olivaceomarginata]
MPLLAVALTYGSFGDIKETARLTFRIIDILYNGGRPSSEGERIISILKGLYSDVAIVLTLPGIDSSSAHARSAVGELSAKLALCHSLLAKLYAKIRPSNGIVAKIWIAMSEAKALASWRAEIARYSRSQSRFSSTASERDSYMAQSPIRLQGAPVVYGTPTGSGISSPVVPFGQVPLWEWDSSSPTHHCSVPLICVRRVGVILTKCNWPFDRNTALYPPVHDAELARRDLVRGREPSMIRASLTSGALGRFFFGTRISAEIVGDSWRNGEDGIDSAVHRAPGPVTPIFKCSFVKMFI